MAKIKMVNATFEAIESGETEEPLRPYLGYSSFGHDCPNYLWLTFRWAYKRSITPRLQRLFNRGHNEEPIIVADLERAGMICSNVVRDGMSDKEAEAAQLECVGFLGHIKGHPDGDVINVPEAPKTLHNLEMKTANDKKFKEFFKFGVMRSNPTYYAQIQAYMFHKGQTRTLFVITNKNTDDRYYERIEIDKDHFIQLEERAADIIMATTPQSKIASKPEWFACKFCDAKEVCHNGVAYEKGCRTCLHSRIKDKGEWYCSVYPGKAIPESFQRTGCATGYLPL